MQELAALGANIARNPQQLAEAADVVCSVVMNDGQTLDVLLGSDGDGGALSALAPGSLIVLAAKLAASIGAPVPITDFVFNQTKRD